MNNLSLRELPLEILAFHIFQFLDDLWLFANVRKVCHDWNDIIIGKQLNIISTTEHHSDTVVVEPHLGFIKKLDGVDLKQRSSRFLAFYKCCQQGYFKNIRELCMGGLNDEHLKDDKSDFFCFFPELTILDLSCKPTLFNNHVSTYGREALLKAQLKHLTYLNLNHCYLSWDTAARIFQVLGHTLKYLHLRQTQLSSRNYTPLMKKPLLEHVQELDVSGNKMNYELLFSAVGQSLTSLDLSSNSNINHAIEIIANSNPEKWTNLRILKLQNVHFNYETLALLKKTTNLMNLTRLDLRGNFTSQREAKELCGVQSSLVNLVEIEHDCGVFQLGQ
ncbi:hypothetical protein C9374_012327 [Naegleria lovaniensis]|uniref:F-box domain-containing protein n=1 Tax=Naegleria lovaniensis TaxID=51637 RepID=A0AA88GCM1_NAELO|nr:uncharacterized protein C9374_012327 [Naegleria lovaniensis]KAG2373224.1 hypothetical protein C9374_012327 [Naegleria lovaniensis]